MPPIRDPGVLTTGVEVVVRGKCRGQPQSSSGVPSVLENGASRAIREHLQQARRHSQPRQVPRSQPCGPAEEPEPAAGAPRIAPPSISSSRGHDRPRVGTILIQICSRGNLSQASNSRKQATRTRTQSFVRGRSHVLARRIVSLKQKVSSSMPAAKVEASTPAGSPSPGLTACAPHKSKQTQVTRLHCTHESLNLKPFRPLQPKRTPARPPTSPPAGEAAPDKSHAWNNGLEFKLWKAFLSFIL